MAKDDIDRYRALLRVDKHHLDDELVRQSEVLEEIGRRTASAELAATLAKDELEREEAREYRAIKAEEPKATVEAIKAAITLSKPCVHARNVMIEARRVADEWQSLSKAWYARGFDIKTLAELYASDYFALTQTSVSVRTPNDKEIRRTVRRVLRDA